jgi:hypothetical protein
MTKNDVKTIDDLELYYNKVRKIRFDKKIEIKSIQDIFKHTIEPDIPNQETFFVKGRLQCEDNRDRSLDDVIKLCKFYFPKSTIKEILSEIYKFEEQFVRGGFHYGYCRNIRKYNFRGRSYWESFKLLSKNMYMSTQNFFNLDVTFEEIVK